LNTPSSNHSTEAPSASETVTGNACPMIVVTATWW
jgi:hypothetical protein